MTHLQSTHPHIEHHGLSIAMTVGVVSDAVCARDPSQLVISLIVNEKPAASLIKVLAGPHALAELRPVRAADLIGAVISVRGRLEGTPVSSDGTARPTRAGREQPLRFVASKVEVLIAADKTKMDSHGGYHTDVDALRSHGSDRQPAA